MIAGDDSRADEVVAVPKERVRRRPQAKGPANRDFQGSVEAPINSENPEQAGSNPAGSILGLAAMRKWLS
jgi:hypothetical protein